MLTEALDRMPHRGRMRLIDTILSADKRSIVCRATDHRPDDYPLRIDGVLIPAMLIEIGAQAAAAHTSIHGIGAAHTGLVVALSNVEIRRDTVSDDAPLDARAEVRQVIGDSARYRFEVSDAEGLLVTGEVLLQMWRH